MKRLSRRDFLKASGAVAVSMLSSNLFSLISPETKRPNIIIILMDALSARHLSLYGYPRLTSPAMAAFAESSTVFHQHYSGSNFTTSGTASMLTGMFPWKHRAINGGGVIASDMAGANPYTLLGSDYYRFAFAQNLWASRLIGQAPDDVERFLSPYSYTLLKDNKALMSSVRKNGAPASVAFDNLFFAIDGENELPGSLTLGYFAKSQIYNIANSTAYPPSYASGLPEAMDGVFFRNEEVYYGVYEELTRLQKLGRAYFAYFHLFSPHRPYNSRNDYRKLFHDSYEPVAKPPHHFHPSFSHPHMAVITTDAELKARVLYDRLVAQVDDEFGKLITRLKESGVLDNSYLIVTSDHGEMFERGFNGHGYDYLFEGVIHIPLLIHAPRQTKRQDVFSITSNVDILPTILSFAGKTSPANVDGRILPGFGGQEDADRPVFSVTAMDNSAFSPIKKATISMRKYAYKIIAYLGHEGNDRVYELYNLEKDPDELDDLSSKESIIFLQMKNELEEYLNEANRGFAQKGKTE